MAPITNSKVYDSDLMLKLRTRHEGLGPALQKVSGFLLANPYRSATLNIEELAAVTGTSTAAVNRMANAIGLNGFTGLRFALMENLLAVVSAADTIHERLQHSSDKSFYLNHQISLSKHHLDNVARMNDNQTFEDMARQLVRSQNVFCGRFGQQFSYRPDGGSRTQPFLRRRPLRDAGWRHGRFSLQAEQHHQRRCTSGHRPARLHPRNHRHGHVRSITRRLRDEHHRLPGVALGEAVQQEPVHPDRSSGAASFQSKADGRRRGLVGAGPALEANEP